MQRHVVFVFQRIDDRTIAYIFTIICSYLPLESMYFIMAFQFLHVQNQCVIYYGAFCLGFLRLLLGHPATNRNVISSVCNRITSLLSLLTQTSRKARVTMRMEHLCACANGENIGDDKHEGSFALAPNH